MVTTIPTYIALTFFLCSNGTNMQATENAEGSPSSRCLFPNVVEDVDALLVLLDVGLPATQIQPRDHSNSGVADLGRKGREGGTHVPVKVAMDLTWRPADGGGGWGPTTTGTSGSAAVQ